MKPETKKIIIRVVNITMWCVLISGLFICLGFVEKEQNKSICKNLTINIIGDDEVFFVQQEDIKHLLRDRGDQIINQSVKSINIPQIEKIVNSHPSVSAAQVYMTINGELNIDISQRKPLVRIINENGESYYLDTLGKLMLLSDNYSAKVVVVNGKINEPYAKWYNYSIEDIEKNSLLRDSTLLDEVFCYATYINKNFFWKAQVQQLYVNEDSEFEVIPRVGEHLILFGDTSEIDEKFDKLMIFYKEGMNKTGSWNNYSTINLKFKNQIVCTKKGETKLATTISPITTIKELSTDTTKISEKQFKQKNNDIVTVRKKSSQKKETKSKKTEKSKKKKLK